MDALLHVLIIEESEADLQLLLDELRQGDYNLTYERVETVSALSLALDHRVCDLVIANCSTSNFKVPAALQLLQARGLDLPLLMIASPADETKAVEAMRAGARDYVIKGNLARLVPAVERELHEVKLRQQKRQAEESLLQLAAIVNSSDDAIISTTLDGCILSWNPGAEKMYGYTAAEAQGKRLSHLLQPPDPAALLMLEERQQLEELDHHQTIHMRKDGELIDVFLTVSSVKDATGKITGTSMIARDVSDRRAIEKMKDEFVSIVSHELRTPLTSIRGSLGLLLTGKLGELSSRGQRMLEIAVNNTDRLVRLINDILDLERMESGKVALAKQNCNIADLIAQAADVMQAMADKAGIHLDVTSLSAQIWADPDRIIQTLTNLLSNAIKFSPVGSTIWLKAELVEQEQLRKNSVPGQPLHSLTVPFYLLISIRDQGRGVPADKLQTIFGRFQQVDASDSRQKGGTGLGLAISRSIVQQHGGRLWVESTLGEGSTFFLTLPVEPQLEATPVTTSPHRSLILVCDALLSSCSAVQTLLKQENCQIFTATSGQEMIEQATTLRPAAILLDLSMPGTSGWETIAVLKERPDTRNIPIIIFSLASLESSSSQNTGGTGQVYQPADQVSLLQTLGQILRRQVQASRVLIVEDSLDLAHLLIVMFESHEIQTSHAKTATEAIQLCEQVTPDLIVLDLVLPEGNGFAVVDWLRQSEQLSKIPLIVYTAKELDDSERSRLQLGQTEFMTKSRISPAELEQQVVALLSRLL